MPPPKGASISGLQCARAPVLARCSLDKKLRCGFRVVFFFFFTCFPRKNPRFCVHLLYRNVQVFSAFSVSATRLVSSVAFVCLSVSLSLFGFLVGGGGGERCGF